jgi:hypothetical protein
MVHPGDHCGWSAGGDDVVRRRLTILVCCLALLAAGLPPTGMATAPTISRFKPSGTSLATGTRFNGGTLPITLGTGTTGAASASTITTSAIPTNTARVTVTPVVHLSRRVAPPTATVLVSGSGYTTNGAVDLYFDTTHLVIVIADRKGTFTKASLFVPRSATPGRHWISAVDRRTSTGAQKPITVRTDWRQFHDTADKAGNNGTQGGITPPHWYDLVAADVDGPSRRVLIKAVVGASPWSPVGRYIAVQRDRSVLLVDPRTGSSRRLATDILGDSFRWWWAPDGRSLIVLKGEVPASLEVVRYDLAGLLFVRNDGSGTIQSTIPGAEYVAWRP